MQSQKLVETGLGAPQKAKMEAGGRHPHPGVQGRYLDPKVQEDFLATALNNEIKFEALS